MDLFYTLQSENLGQLHYQISKCSYS